MALDGRGGLGGLGSGGKVISETFGSYKPPKKMVDIFFVAE